MSNFENMFTYLATLTFCGFYVLFVNVCDLNLYHAQNLELVGTISQMSWLFICV